MAELAFLIYGAGGHGKVVADVIQCAGGRIAAFVDDAAHRHGEQHFGAPVVSWSRIDDLPEPAQAYVLVPGIGENPAREATLGKARARGFVIGSAVHPSAIVARSATLGAGTVVMAGAIVNADARVGEAVVLNTASLVEHDCVIGAYVHLCPHARLGGTVTIGDRSLVGIGATVLPNLTVGARVTIGGGAVVVRDVADDATVVGVPARPLR